MNKLICLIGLRWIWIVVRVIVLDFASKQWVINHLVLDQPEFLMPWFNLYYTHNYGAAFSLLASHGIHLRWLFVCITIIIITVFIATMYRHFFLKKLSNIACAFIVGGALGNLIDRLRAGFVIDFIDLHIGDWHYPIFNLADIFICSGAIIILLEDFLSPANKSLKNKGK